MNYEIHQLGDILTVQDLARGHQIVAVTFFQGDLVAFTNLGKMIYLTMRPY